MTSKRIEKIVSLYRLLSQNTILNGAKILDDENVITIQSFWTQKNLECKINQRFVQNYTLDRSLKLIVQSYPITITSELASVFTKDGQSRAVLRQVSIDNSMKQFIEIWNQQRLVKNYDLSALDVHGDVYTDTKFSSFKWSPDGTKLLYIAEKKLPKSEPFYKQKSLDKKDKDGKKEDQEATSIGNEYIYKPDWGEQLVGKHRPVVVVLDTTLDTIVVSPGIPDDLSPGQVIWTPDGQGVIGVAWKHEPRQLGIIFCNNRPSWIFILENGNFKKLSANDCAVHSPRLSPNGKQLIWLERPIKPIVPHHDAHRLMRVELNSHEKQIDILIDIVETSKTTTNGKIFYGLYDSLPTNCWSRNSQYVFLSTCQETNVRSYIIDTNTRNITEIQRSHNDSTSLEILDVQNDVLAFSTFSLIEPPSLLVGIFNLQTLDDGILKTTKVTTPLQIPGFENCMYENTRYNYQNAEAVQNFNFTYFGSKNGANKSVPLIVLIHGGPHSTFVNTFSLETSLFVLLGFAVLRVNYRGSTGMGSNSVKYLQGKVGDVDVKDCVTATKEALKKYSWLDPQRVALCGGSHGGFLVTHLSGQYPDLYKVVCAVNPVIDIATMFSTTDIPDWCMAEMDYPSDEMSESNLIEMHSRMLKASPIVHVDKVKAPTLICLGKNDLRVPPSQGKSWYHHLKANNIETKLLVYDDNHSLQSGNASIDFFINACLWFIEHTFVED